jgi:type II secretory pathway predicted ATPase ExeA
MDFYGLERDFQAAGFFETEQHHQLMRAIRPTLLSGKLAAITGPVGSGKTLFLHRFEAILKQEGRLTVARSLSVDKDRTTLATLIAALFYDLSPEKNPKIPTHGEERERALRELIRRGRKPVVLIVDEAHDLHSKTAILAQPLGKFRMPISAWNRPKRRPSRSGFEVILKRSAGEMSKVTARAHQQHQIEQQAHC